MMFLFWSVDSPASRAVVENELQHLGWDAVLIGECLDSLTKKGLISQHWLGHGNTQKEFYMVQISESDYWRNTGCACNGRETGPAAARQPCTILWI